MTNQGRPRPTSVRLYGWQIYALATQALERRQLEPGRWDSSRVLRELLTEHLPRAKYPWPPIAAVVPRRKKRSRR